MEQESFSSPAEGEPSVPAQSTDYWSSNSCRWAVCPRLRKSNIYGRPLTFTAKHFVTKEEGSKWQDTSLPTRNTAETEAHWVVSVALNEPLLTNPGKTPRELDWIDLIPVRNLSGYRGKSPRGERVEFHLRGNLLERAQDSQVDVPEDGIVRLTKTITELGRDLDPRPTCALGPDWDFNTIEADALERPGHNFESESDDLAIKFFFFQLEEVVRDLVDSLEARHPELPIEAVADFLTSWEVHWHVASACNELAVWHYPKEVDRVEKARRAVLSRLAIYAREICPTQRPEPSTSDVGPGKRGRTINKTRHAGIYEVVARICDPNYKETWKTRLPEIFKALDRKARGNQKAEVSIKPSWKGRKEMPSSWVAMDSSASLRGLAVKEIEYSLKQAEKLKKEGKI
jgi:hypothetical protein